jgi:hypothetical protein
MTRNVEKRLKVLVAGDILEKMATDSAFAKGYHA